MQPSAAMNIQDQATAHDDEDHSMSLPTDLHTPHDDMATDPSGPAHVDGTNGQLVAIKDLSIDPQTSAVSVSLRPFTFVAPVGNMDSDHQTTTSGALTKPSSRRRIVRGDISNLNLLPPKTQTEKRKRTDGEEEERERAVRLIRFGSNDNEEWEESVYQLKMDIADLQRANKSLQDEVTDFRVLDMSLVNDIDLSTATTHERKLVAVINGLKNQAEQLLLASGDGLADFEPSTDTKRKLFTRINQLEVLNNTAETQRQAFMTSLKNAEKARDAASQQSMALQEINTQVQSQLRELQTARPESEENTALKVQIACLLDDKTGLQRRIASYQRAEKQSSVSDAALGEHLQHLLFGLEEGLTKLNDSNNGAAQEPQMDDGDIATPLDEEPLQASLPLSLGAEVVNRVRRLVSEIDKLCHDKSSLEDSLSQAQRDNSALSTERDHLALREKTLQTLLDHLKSESTAEAERLTGKVSELLRKQNFAAEKLSSTQTENLNLLGRLKEIEENHEVERMFESAQNDTAIRLEDLRATLVATQKDYDLEKQKAASLRKTLDESATQLKEVNETHQEQMEGLKAIYNQTKLEIEGKLKASYDSRLEELRNSAQREAERLKGDAKSAKSQVDFLQRQCDTLKAEKEDLENAKARTEGEIEESNETNQQQMEELKAIHGRMRIELEDKLKAMKTHYEEEKQKNAALKQQIVNLQADLGNRENNDTLKAKLENTQRSLMISNCNQRDRDDAQAALAGARIEMDENNVSSYWASYAQFVDCYQGPSRRHTERTEEYFSNGEINTSSHWIG
ncbi:hypothetical protein VKT23_013853 [Stygiomarasmius scandens]|uniref:Uncharacterized protein n=1 Tax=Marasmiellus scandens TaxID=2682957 RepID=A0ABR1J6N4_9AGAR